MKCTVDLELTPAPPGKGLLDPENVPTYVFTGGEVVVAEDEEVEVAVPMARVPWSTAIINHVRARERKRTDLSSK